MKKIIFLFLTLFFFILFPQRVMAESFSNNEELMEGVVIEILDEGIKKEEEGDFLYQELKILMTKGSLKGHHLELNNSAELQNYRKYDLDDKLRIYSSYNFEEERQFIIEGKVKRDALFILMIIFILLVLLVGKKWGFLSLLALFISFLFIFKVTLPLIIGGIDPILVSFLTAFFIIPITFYISHGFKKKTHVAVLATFISLLITIFLAIYFVGKANLTGFSSEEANFLDYISGGKINIFALMVAGIIIGVLGILDDITISQSAIIKQLKELNPKIKNLDLFKKGMKIGQDHISSMVNTLVLVYAGSSLPLLLLFFDANKTFIDVIELEMMAEEIIKILVGSIGLVLAAPLSTALAVFFFSKNNKKKE